MAEKRYYWLKLEESYFDNPKIKKLRKIAGGDTYTIIYLKLQLLSISNKGIITFEGIENTFEEELALKLDEDVEDVRIVLAYLKTQGLIENNEQEFLLPDACKRIGSEGKSAERVRLFRERKNNNMLQCNTNVTPVLQNSISISNSISNNIEKIINYLNEKANKNYKTNTNSTIKHITARLNEGYTVDDFFKVIDRKVDDWKGTTYEKYLRPETLFGSKFEGYLNENGVTSKPTTAFRQREYTDKELNSLYDNLENVEF